MSRVRTRCELQRRASPDEQTLTDALSCVFVSFDGNVTASKINEVDGSAESFEEVCKDVGSAESSMQS